jgi:hypothetical protein
MKISNPVVFLHESELFCLTDNPPTEPKYSDHVQLPQYYWQVRKFERLKKEYERALALAKSSAVKVKNNTILDRKFFPEADTLYTLKGYEAEITKHLIAYATITPLKESYSKEESQDKLWEELCASFSLEIEQEHVNETEYVKAIAITCAEVGFMRGWNQAMASIADTALQSLNQRNPSSPVNKP